MHKIALAATAAITAVGLSAAQTAASVRAGICRIGAFKCENIACSGLSEASVPDDCLPFPVAHLPLIETRLLQLAGATADQLAAIGLRRAWLRGPVLIYASSDRGQRCALVITQ